MNLAVDYSRGNKKILIDDSLAIDFNEGRFTGFSRPLDENRKKFFDSLAAEDSHLFRSFSEIDTEVLLRINGHKRWVPCRKSLIERMNSFKKRKNLLFFSYQFLGFDFTGHSVSVIFDIKDLKE